MAKRRSKASRKRAMPNRRKPTRGRPSERHVIAEPIGLPALEPDRLPGDDTKDLVRGLRLTAGDPDADWRRADSVGEEAVGGSVATPDQDSVDALGDALGVPRGPDEELRTSSEILEGRDQYRAEQEP
jgi:hypothetical protein